MIEEKIPINSLDILFKGDLVATIVADEEIKCTGSNEMGFFVSIGGVELVIAAEKIQINTDNT